MELSLFILSGLTAVYDNHLEAGVPYKTTGQLTFTLMTTQATS